MLACCLRAWDSDSAHHLTYIHHVLTRGSLPLADEGWQMYGAAVVIRFVRAAGRTAAFLLQNSTEHDKPGGAIFSGLVVGLAHVALIWLSLRLIFRPNHDAACRDGSWRRLCR